MHSLNENYFPENITIDQAVTLQKKLAKKIIAVDLFEEIKTVAGVDVAYAKETDQMVAAVVVLDAKTLELLQVFHKFAKSSFPYQPGLFSFRELPPVIQIFKEMPVWPDLVICDAQGMAHPRKCGLASHLGLILDMPTIGCAKTPLYGAMQGDIGLQPGDRADLLDEESHIIGAGLRTQQAVKPVYVSVGHKISLDTACQWVLHCSRSYRLPETTRFADQEVRKLLKSV